MSVWQWCMPPPPTGPVIGSHEADGVTLGAGWKLGLMGCEHSRQIRSMGSWQAAAALLRRVVLRVFVGNSP
jgi:hypothetical protein